MSSLMARCSRRCKATGWLLWTRLSNILAPPPVVGRLPDRLGKVLPALALGKPCPTGLPPRRQGTDKVSEM